jgi:hypothetical protein
MTKTPPHKKTILYIVPVGREPIPAEVVPCSCEETKGNNHVSAKCKKE